MTAWTGTTYEYFSADSLSDLSTATLALGLVYGTYPVTATHVTDEPTLTRLNTSGCAGNSAPRPGYTRYWWSALLGTGQTITLEQGLNKIYGLLTDSPESIPFTWNVYIE